MIIPFQTKVSGLLVKVPRDARGYQHRRWLDHNSIIFCEDIASNVPLKEEEHNVYIGTGSWQPLGEITSLTDEQKRAVCESHPDIPSVFMNYQKGYFQAYDWWLGRSFSSLLKSLEVYSENPQGKKPERRVPFMGAGHYTENQLEEIKQYDADLRYWNLAQERVGKWLLLIKKQD